MCKFTAVKRVMNDSPKNMITYASSIWRKKINFRQVKIVTVEIKNDLALSLLHNLESMNILKVIENKIVPGKQKLSERFSGCLSNERTDELQKELTQMRNEWERDI